MRKVSGILLFTFIVGLTLMQGYADKVAVTEVNTKETGNKTIAEVVINGRIKIRDIEVEKSGLRYPEYVSKTGKVYPQVRVLSEEVNDEIIKSIETGVVSESKDTLNWEIVKFGIYERKSSLKVFATVRFNEAVDVECRIFDGKYGLWVAWPSRKDRKTDKWFKQVLVKKEMRKQIEKVLIDRYRTLIEEGFDEE